MRICGLKCYMHAYMRPEVLYVYADICGAIFPRGRRPEVSYLKPLASRRIGLIPEAVSLREADGLRCCIFA